VTVDQLEQRFQELDDRATALVDEGRIFDAIAELTAANRLASDPRVESRLLHLRHEAYDAIGEQHPPEVWPRVVPDQFATAGVPELDRADVTADLLASAVTNHGCLHVRGLLDADGTRRMTEAIDEAFRACDARQYTEPDVWPGTWFTTFHPGPRYPKPENFHRAWVRHAGGVLAADSPPAFFVMAELFEEAGLREVVGGYLGEQPVLAVDKVTLRRVPLDLKVGEWHQDGAFLGDGIRSLNVWLALTDCGGDEPSPGLELVPRRVTSLLERGTDGAYFPWSIGHDLVMRECADTPTVRPTFRAGDALLFDDLLVHRTALDPSHTRERYAIESWFFGSTHYPDTSTPVVF
jgi:hypothetical protein